MKYRKKPVVIEAFKWTGDIIQKEDPEWIIEAIKDGIVWLIIVVQSCVIWKLKH